MKKKLESRSVLLHPEAKTALATWLLQLRATKGMTPDLYVFHSRKGVNRPIGKCQAWKILHEAVTTNELTGKVSTHSMRKTFANRVYDKLDGRLERVQKALGHKNINSTVSYLSFREEDIDAAILAS